MLNPKDPVAIILARDAFQRQIQRKAYQRQEQATRAYRGANYGAALPSDADLAIPGTTGSVTRGSDAPVITITGGDYRGDRNKIAGMIQQASDARRQAREASTSAAAAVTTSSMATAAASGDVSGVLARDVAGLAAQKASGDDELLAKTKAIKDLTTPTPIFEDPDWEDSTENFTAADQQAELRGRVPNVREELTALMDLLGISARPFGAPIASTRGSGLSFSRDALQTALTNAQAAFNSMSAFPKIFDESLRRFTRQVLSGIQTELNRLNLTSNPAIGAYAPSSIGLDSVHPQAALLAAPLPAAAPPPAPGMMASAAQAMGSVASGVGDVVGTALSVGTSALGAFVAAPFTGPATSAMGAARAGGATVTNQNTAGAVPVPTAGPGANTIPRMAALAGAPQGDTGASNTFGLVQRRRALQDRAAPGSAVTGMYGATETGLAGNAVQTSAPGGASGGGPTLATMAAQAGRAAGATAALAATGAVAATSIAALGGLNPLATAAATGVLGTAAAKAAPAMTAKALDLVANAGRATKNEWAGLYDMLKAKYGAMAAADAMRISRERAQALAEGRPPPAFTLRGRVGQAVRDAVEFLAQPITDAEGNPITTQGGRRKRQPRTRKRAVGGAYYGFEPAYDFNTDGAAWRNQMPASALGSEPHTPPYSDVQPYTGLIGRPPGKVEKYKPSKAQLAAAKQAKPTGIPIVDDVASDVEDQAEQARKSDEADGVGADENEVMAIARGKRPREAVGDAADKIRARMRGKLSEKRIKLLSSLKESLGRQID